MLTDAKGKLCWASALSAAARAQGGCMCHLNCKENGAWQSAIGFGLAHEFHM